MPDPRLVSRAQRAATMLERAWDRWRSVHGLAAEPLPPVSSYVGYSIEEPWGRPRVVFGVDAADAEKLAALLLECAGSSRAAGQPASAGETLRAGLPQKALDHVRACIPVQGRTAELNGASDQHSEPSRELHGDGSREQRGDGAGEQRSEEAGEQRGDGAREQSGDGARDQRRDADSEQRDDGASEQRSEPAQVAGSVNGFDPIQAGAQPGGSEPGVSQPGMSEPGVSEAGVSEAGVSEAGRAGVGVSSAPGGAPDEDPAGPAGPDGLATSDDPTHDEQEPSASAGRQPPGDSAVPRTRVGGDAGDRRDPGRGVADTMAAELAGWAAGELPGQASARLAAWAAVGGFTSRGALDADLRTGGGAAEQVS